MFKLHFVVSIYREYITNKAVGCVVFIMTFSQSDVSLV